MVDLSGLGEGRAEGGLYPDPKRVGAPGIDLQALARRLRPGRRYSRRRRHCKGDEEHLGFGV